jgi:hypothetical protein
LDFKREKPMIADADPDLDSHDLKFDSMIACYSVGTKKPRDIDKLYMYASGFKDGTTRRKVYDNAFRRAMRSNRIPGEAAAVLVEIRKDLRTYIWETPMQKCVRLDKEYHGIEQGGLSHSDFRALFESKLQDMEESLMDMPTVTTLYRNYLVKLNPELRQRVLSKDFKIDGPESPPRPPTTYKEIALAIGLLLEEKADIHATGQGHYDSLMNIDGTGMVLPKASMGGQKKGGQLQCAHCNMIDNHNTVVCPQKAADTRGDAEACRSRASSAGVRCSICSQPGHEQRHHMLAIQDYKDRGKQSTGPAKETRERAKGRNLLQKVALWEGFHHQQ